MESVPPSAWGAPPWAWISAPVSVPRAPRFTAPASLQTAVGAYLPLAANRSKVSAAPEMSMVEPGSATRAWPCSRLRGLWMS